ncbi:hypothetical protein LR48_Vigan107s000200 [Vigna angularis]|uniref:non-specific serine/threonine protein kinase n=1 Tax=Phaseolus angularis TaxID=3914 RepID=A0A0L9T4I0_PHAAN|nr:hypothetical protein LR48_Vigan107s000200 [Vigna angularis]
MVATVAAWCLVAGVNRGCILQRLVRILGAVIELNCLNLSRNNFSRSIPSSFWGISNLISFNISYNRLEGPLLKNGAFLNASIESLKNNKGVGGQGNVYKADFPLGEVYAVKKLHPGTNGEKPNFKAFENEIQALTEIRHRHEDSEDNRMVTTKNMSITTLGESSIQQDLVDLIRQMQCQI